MTVTIASFALHSLSVFHPLSVDTQLYMILCMITYSLNIIVVNVDEYYVTVAMSYHLDRNSRISLC
jgi:hypothetical protein